MNPARSKEAVALAYRMKREMISGLKAQIKLQQEMLLVTEKELNEIQWLDGEKLVLVMSGLDANEVLKHQQSWIKELRELITDSWDLEEVA